MTTWMSTAVRAADAKRFKGSSEASCSQLYEVISEEEGGHSGPI